MLLASKFLFGRVHVTGEGLWQHGGKVLPASIDMLIATTVSRRGVETPNIRKQSNGLPVYCNKSIFHCLLRILVVAVDSPCLR